MYIFVVVVFLHVMKIKIPNEATVAPIKRELTNDEVLNVKQRARESLQFWKSEEEKRGVKTSRKPSSSSTSSSSHTTSHASNSTSNHDYTNNSNQIRHSRQLSNTTTTTSYSANSRITGGRVLTGCTPNTGHHGGSGGQQQPAALVHLLKHHNQNRRVKDTINAFESKFQQVVGESNTGGRDSTSAASVSSSSTTSSSSSTSTSSSSYSSSKPVKSVFKTDPIRLIKRNKDNSSDLELNKCVRVYVSFNNFRLFYNQCQNSNKLKKDIFFI